MMNKFNKISPIYSLMFSTSLIILTASSVSAYPQDLDFNKPTKKAYFTASQTDDFFLNKDSYQLLTLPEKDSDLSLEKPAKISQIDPVDCVFIKEIKLIRSDGEKIVFHNNPELTKITNAFQETTVCLEDLQEVADKVTQLYLDQGYILSRAIQPETLADIENEIATIVVIEGFLKEIIIEGAPRLENYVRQRIELVSQRPLNYKRLEERLRLLEEDPLIEDIEATLKPPEDEKLGENILIVKLTEGKPFSGRVGFDNYSVPNIGAVRFNLDLGYRNLTGLGDGLSISYRPRVQNFGGTYRLDLNYQVPVNAMDGKVGFRTLIERNQVINGDFESLDISGRSEYYELSYRQPIIKELNEELALSFGISYRDGQTFTFSGPTPFGFGPDENGVSKINVLTFGQEYSLRESSGAWGFRSQFRVGVGIFDVTDNPSPIPDGYFFAWLGQIQRLQVIDENNLLIMQLDMQFTPDSLLPSEQFTIGGGQSVRGYRQNALTADNGIRFSIEDRFTVVRNKAGESYFQLAPFLDMGGVWNVKDNPNSLVENQTFIIGVGLGVLWQPLDGMLVRLDYAPPIINLDTRGDNIQDDGFYFSINYQF